MKSASEAQLLCRCSDCATLFRIAKTELMSHSGLVRCGDCGTVFNAAWNLVDEITNPAQSKTPAETVPVYHNPKETITGGQRDNRETVSNISSNTRLFSLDDQLRQDLKMDVDSSSSLEEIRQAFDEADGSIGLKNVDSPSLRDVRNTRQNNSFKNEDPSSSIAIPMLPTAATRNNGNRASAKTLPLGQRIRVQTLWLLVICIAAISLYGQVRYWLFDELAAIPMARTPLESFCRIAGCTVPTPLIGPAFMILETRVDLDPQLPDAVIVKVHLENRTTIPRPFPDVKLILTDRAGDVIGKRTYTANDYETTNNAVELSPDIVSVITLHLAEPDKRAVGFEARVADR